MGTLSKIAKNCNEEWKPFIHQQVQSPYFKKLEQRIEPQLTEIAPSASQIFRVFAELPPSKIKVIILGQDPYHGPNQANGLSFSVNRRIAVPPSLRNIYKELQNDLGCNIPVHGDLSSWLNEGVFLLNAALSVKLGEANSHGKWEWQEFTAQTMDYLNVCCEPSVFILWGKFAQQHQKRINLEKHLVLSSAHPSPLGAYRGFWGSKPFSKANAFLLEKKRGEINWCVK